MLVPHFRRYFNSEFINYHKKVVEISNKYTVLTPKIGAQVIVLNTAVTNLTSVFGLDQGSDLTDTIIVLDSGRDDALTGIRLNADSFSRHFDETKRAASKTIVDAIDRHGKNLARLNYNAESEVITKIVTDATTAGPIADAVGKLALAEWFSELDKANHLFGDTYLGRTAEMSGKPTATTLAERVVTENAYNDLIKHIQANNLLTPAEDYNKLEKEIDTLTEEFDLVAKRRQPKKPEVPPTTPING